MPASVGVDIGCGMLAVRTTLTADKLPHSLARLRSAIEARVPVGMAMAPFEGYIFWCSRPAPGPGCCVTN